LLKRWCPKEVEKQGEAALSIKLMEGSNYVTRLTAHMDAYRPQAFLGTNRVIASLKPTPAHD